MPFPSLQPPSPEMSLDDVKNYLIGFIRNMNWLLSELDDLNVNNITAKSIKVDQLSSISADLGTITAGIIIGALIKTAASSFPRIELSSSDNLMTAYQDADNFVAIDPDLTGAPTVYFNSTGGIKATFAVDGTGNLSLLTVDGLDINIGAAHNLLLYSQGSAFGFHVQVNNWDSFQNKATSETLQEALDAKADAFSGFTGTLYVATTSGGSATHALNVVNGIITS